MTIHRSALNKRVLVTLRNGDALRGRVHRVRKDGIMLSRPELVRADSPAQELGGALIIPADSIVTTQLEDSDGV